jgi:hypothetical protein
MFLALADHALCFWVLGGSNKEVFLVCHVVCRMPTKMVRPTVCRIPPLISWNIGHIDSGILGAAFVQRSCKNRVTIERTDFLKSRRIVAQRDRDSNL